MHLISGNHAVLKPLGGARERLPPLDSLTAQRVFRHLKYQLLALFYAVLASTRHSTGIVISNNIIGKGEYAAQFFLVRGY